jgi:hypothetical protein
VTLRKVVVRRDAVVRTNRSMWMWMWVHMCWQNMGPWSGAHEVVGVVVR